MKISNGWKKKGFLGIGVLLMVLLFCFGLNRDGAVKAASEYVIRFANEENGSNQQYELRNRTITAVYVDSNNTRPAGATVEWTVTDGKDTVLKIVGVTDDSVVSLQAVGAGNATLVATIIDESGNEKVATRIITVGYAIDEDVKDGFMLIPELSESAVMVLSVGETSVNNANNANDTQNKLEFVFPYDYDVTWRSDDSRVVSMSNNTYSSSNTTGYFRAVGTGVTTITASYKPDGVDGTKNLSVKVYVGPAPKVNGTEEIEGTVSVKNKTEINTGAILKESGKTIKQRIEWVIKNEKHEIISTSKSVNEEALLSSPSSPNLTVDAKAGTYHVTLYTAGVYSAGLDSPEVLVKNFEVYVQAETSNIVKSLQVNDTYNIAEAYNMTETDFKECFDIQVATGSGVVVTTQIDEGIVQAGEEGKAVLNLTVSNKNLLAKLTNKDVDKIPSAYTVELNVYKGFVLDRTTVTIAEGTSLALVPNYNEGIAENISWKSLDENFVTVTQKGVITGVKDSNGTEIVVIASMQLSDGRILNATCKVTVTKTAKGIILDKEEIRLKVGEKGQVSVAEFIPSSITSIPGLKWLITNEEVATIKPGTENNVIITAVGAGTAILTAVNEENFVAAYCKVTVLSPITQISIAEGNQMELYLAQESVKLHAEYNYDATDVALLWSSSNTSVAIVDSTGFVQLKGAGTTIITVLPEWNPDNIMAQLRLTVIESATSFGINETSVTIEAGQKVELTWTIKSTNAQTTITWDVLDKSVATISNKGVVTGVSAGTTYVIAKSSEGFVDTCLVTVTQKANGVTVNVSNIKLAVGETYQVTATAVPAKTTDKSFIWTSLNSSVATVDNNGKITGKAAGSTQITVTPPKGGTPAIIVVTVYSKATGMKFEKSEVSIVKGEKFTLKPVFTPANVTDKGVKYTSLNSGIASVDENGVIKAIKGGTTVITGVSDDGGYIATCVVTVKERITTLKLDKKNVNLGVGKSLKLKATVTSNSASNPKLKWTTSNKNIVKVNQQGKITGKKVGTATITVKVTDGSKKKAICKVRVVKAVSSITLNKRVLNIVVGQSEKLKATIKPTDATIKSVTWASENKDIAVVDNGEILGLKVGSTKVTATSKDSSAKSATCYVNVIEEIPATSIILSAQNLTMIKGESQKIGYSIVPHNHTDKVYFDSDNRTIATVNSDGKVYARRAGVANITIVTTSGKQAMVKVMVLGLNKTKVTMEQYDTEILYVDGVTSGVTWFTSNPSIATVQGGKIIARKAGTCTVYAKVNGINLGCTVVVKKINK